MLCRKKIEITCVLCRYCGGSEFQRDQKVALQVFA